MAEGKHLDGAEQQRLDSCTDELTWRKWGPYMTERQWGTVREDYLHHGNPWEAISHEAARSYAYRWGEDAIAGFCDHRQILCMAPAFWNGNDPILKERLFGLTNGQGNHGEDVKEIYFHLESSPTHSYCKYLYKYPHATYPYQHIIESNKIGKDKMEYEIWDTDIFANSDYFDCYIEYAKGNEEDILMKISICNRSNHKQEIHVLPQLWYRNTWRHNDDHRRPVITKVNDGLLKANSTRNGTYYLYFNGGTPLFCDNETNYKKLYGRRNRTKYSKDGINNHVINGDSSINVNERGSKAAIWYTDDVEPGETKVYRVRLSRHELDDPWEEHEHIFWQRAQETEEFYDKITPEGIDTEHKHVVRKALAGLLWTKQFYYLDVYKWLFGGPAEAVSPRAFMRNSDWQHLTNRHIVSMPDKWEYPWYAAWDLAFHATSYAIVDPQFAKGQLQLMLAEYYMHPNGQIPAYEWNFSDVNPPVHSWAVWHVFEQDRKATGKGDYAFLERCFQKLLINFTWWVNQKDKEGNSLFEGGFLGLDNIGVFDRNQMPPGIKKMQQADATSWMAMFSLNMLRMSVELARENSAYEESAAKFFRHFLNMAWAMHHIGGKDISLWDDEDAFYYDVVQMEDGYSSRLKVRSLVGIIPMFAVDVLHTELFDELKEFKQRAGRIIRTRPDLAKLISRIEEKNEHGYYLISIMRAYRLEQVLKRLLDEEEFLSPFGIRSLSKYHEENPYVFRHHGEHRIKYVPEESDTDMFGGNSNWRGPIWFPLNYLIIQSLLRYYKYYGPTYIYEYPTGSGNKLNLKEIAIELTKRLMRLFERDDKGKYHYHNDDPNHLFTKEDHFKDHHLFYEFFHGETGRGMGASHQTGWTALIANLILELKVLDKK